MPEVYTELTAPTAVSHSLTIHFTSATAENLIVARTSLLQIFSTTTHETELPPSNGTSSSDPANKEKEGGIDRRALDADEEGTFAADIALQRSQVQTVTKLVLVAEYNLCGSVTGMQRIRLLASKSGGEALLLSFKDAKLSLLEWDPSTNAVTTISLHYYEREEFWPSVVSEGLSTTLVADPGSRCAALNFAGDMIAILPFRQREDEDLSLGNVDGAGHDLHMAEGEDDDWDPSAPEKKPEDDLDSEMAGTTDKTKEDAMAAKLIAADRPYHPSFVLPVSRLDDAISHVISLTFLHEYRGPTFGILYSPRRTWAGLLAAEGRKDTISYIVITLDLEQRASTPILSVSGLPYDIFKVVALAPPIGGSLLIGGNEIIHLDQAGKTTGVAVNPYTKKSTTFAGLADQSNLCLELEGSSVVELEGENGDILLITKKGEAVIIGFKTDGRNVSGVKITRLANHPTSLVGGRVSTLVALGSRRLFVGCTEGDARLLKWKRKGEKKKPGESLKEEVAENEDEEDVYKMLEDMDDDLYGGGDSSYKKAERKDGGVKPMGEYIFSTHDRLLNLGPFRDIVLGRPTFTPDSVSRQVGVTPELELVTTAGPINTPEDAGVSVLRKSIAPTVVGKLDFPSCQALWTVRARSGKTAVNSALAGLTSGEEDQGGAEEEFDGFLFVSKSEESQVFRVGDTFEEVRGTDFESEGETLEVGVVGGGMRVVQVVSEQVRVYDCDLQLAQIIPMFNEDTGEEGPNVLRARVYDPYVLLVRIDGSVVIYRVHKGNLELVEEERGDRLKSSKYSSGCIYAAKKGEFHPVAAVSGGGSEGKKKSQEEEEEGGETEYVLFLITFEGCLQVYSLANLAEPIFVSEGFSSLPPLLRADDTIEPTTSHSHREKNVKENIVEILVTDLGDQVAKEPFMIVRSARDDLTFYKPFVCPGTSESKPTLRFSKSPNPHLALPINPMKSSSSKTIFRPLVSIQNLAGYTCVFLPGADPSFVLKTSKSIPHVHRLAGNAVRSLAAFHSSGADRGFVYVDNSGIVRVSLMPTEFNFDGNWGARKIAVGDVVQALSYFPPMGVYVVSTTQLVPFDLAEDDGSVAKDKTTLQPEVESGAIKILSPLNWSVVDQFKFAHNEIALVVKTIEMEISEHTKERKQLVAVGTGIFKGEDHSARGGIYVFEIIEVVPEPGKPETNCKLKLVCREEVKGTVSAICGVNGYLLAAQGQKIMVRGLKEDQSLLPVAFMDMSMYVTVAKNLDGMILFGDFMKSIWFTGFSEEPYKMTLFGKDTQTLEVVAADFLPDGNKLYFVVADADSNIHVLQYDPEHPKSLAGQRLIRRADFFAGHEVKTLTMLPRSRPMASDSDPDVMDTVTDTPEEFLVLAGTLTGSLAMITTLPETSYRRLNIVQGQIVSGEEHTAGLNPRGYRAVASSGAAGVGGDLLRGVLDGALVRRWIGFGEGRKSEIASKAGNDIQGIREDLKGLEGALLYL